MKITKIHGKTTYWRSCYTHLVKVGQYFQTFCYLGSTRPQHIWQYLQWYIATLCAGKFPSLPVSRGPGPITLQPLSRSILSTSRCVRPMFEKEFSKGVARAQEDDLRQMHIDFAMSHVLVNRRLWLPTLELPWHLGESLRLTVV